MQCFQRAFSSLSNLNPSACSLPLVYPLFPVSPSYSVHLPALRQPKQQILYPDPFLSQLPPPVVQGKQSSLSHPFFFNGSCCWVEDERGRHLLFLALVPVGPLQLLLPPPLLLLPAPGAVNWPDPSSSSMHIFLYRSTAALITSCLMVAG